LHGGITPVLAARRRTFQVTLGLLWLLDAALQFQPYMFTRAFVRDVILSTAHGNPAVIAGPITWSADLMVRHIVVWNAAFATTQLLLALGLLWRRTSKAALVGSIAWAAAVWWLGEGLGGVLAGSVDPFAGAPGAAVLYVLLALLAWPAATVRGTQASVALSGRLGPIAPRIWWAALWASLAYGAFEPANRSPDGLSSNMSAMRSGEPGWIAALDGALSHVLAHYGTEVSITLSVFCALATATVSLNRLTRLGVVIAVIAGAMIWLAQDFGEIFTGRGTDPNSGLLLIVLAAAFWPVAAPAQKTSPASTTETSMISNPEFSSGDAVRAS
jgi:hypothetical protein